MHDDLIRLIVVDDHPVVREGLKRLFEAQADIQVVADAADGRAAVAAAKEHSADIVVMDLSMRGMDGVAATEALRAACPGVRVLILTIHEEQLYLRRLLRAGAAGYALKRAAPADLVQAVRSVAAGGSYIDPALLGALVHEYATGNSGGTQEQATLSAREREVLIYIAEGYTNKEIAQSLEISVKTVETHKARLMGKLELRSRAEIVRYAARNGWLR